MFEQLDPYKLPEGWRYVKSSDPNCLRIELTTPPDSPFTVLPSSGPSVGMCPACAEIAEAASTN